MNHVEKKIQEEIFDSLSDELKDNGSFCENIIMKNPSLLYYVSDRLKDNPSFVNPIVTKDPSAFIHVSPRLLDDGDFCRPILADWPYLICYISDRLKNDKDYVRSCDKAIIINAGVKDDTLRNSLYKKDLSFKKYLLENLTRDQLIRALQS